MTFYKAYDSSTPQNYAMVIASTFCFMAVIFFIYDITVDERNQKILGDAARINKIVKQVFPEKIRDRLLQQEQHTREQQYHKIPHGNGKKMSSSLITDDDYAQKNSKPIADLFLETTVFFADIVG
jgi:hypothetical protein